MLKNYDSNCRLIKSTGNGGTGKLSGVPTPVVKPTPVPNQTGNLSGVPTPSSNGSLVGSSGSKSTRNGTLGGKLATVGGSKPPSPGGGVNPVIIVLVVLVVLALLYFLLRKKKVLKTLFGKRR